CGAKSTSSTAASSCATTAGSRFDTTLIQPYGCISADRAAGLRPRVRRPRGSHTARHRPPRDQRRGGRPRAGQPLPDELRSGPEARRGSRARRPDHEAAHRPPQGRPHQPRGAARRAPPARPVRGAVAGSDRPHEPAHRRDGRHHRHRGEKEEQTMTVTAVRKDPQRLTLTIEAEFDASVERVWQLWADPRQLERWWGPPTYPATFTKHDLAPGSRIEYHMTGPAGDQPHGYWDVLDVDPPRRIVLRGGCAYADGTLTTEIPISTIRVGIEEIAQGRTRMSIENLFPSTGAMEKILAMRTYEIFAGSWGVWPDPGDSPIWTALNTKPKYVASTTLTEPRWANTTVLSGDTAAAIGELKAKPAGELQVHGSGKLIRWLVDKQLVDEITLLTYPVIIGQGTRLFPDTGRDRALELVESRATSSGVTIQVYRPTGRPEYAK